MRPMFPPVGFARWRGHGRFAPSAAAAECQSDDTDESRCTLRRPPRRRNVGSEPLPVGKCATDIGSEPLGNTLY